MKLKGIGGIIAVGALVGILAVVLVMQGNPKNMGFCIACFIRDIAGGIGMHRAAIVQYIRPEIIGLVLGSFVMAFLNKEFSPRGGSSPFLRVVLGAIVMIGALLFLGCPLRMILRLGGGDLNALVGLAGILVGIAIGVFFLNKGFSLERNYAQKAAEGLAFPLVMLGLLLMLIMRPPFLFFSESGPGSMVAPLIVALGAGLIVGALAQRVRLCLVGGARDFILFRDNYLVTGFVAIFVFSLIGNLLTNNFKLGFEGQPVAHTVHLWNFLGMLIVGWGSVLLGGCPLRQLILAGEGNTDSVMAVVGMLIGAAFAHNFGLAASPAGVTPAGQIAGVIIIVMLAFLSWRNSEGFSGS